MRLNAEVKTAKVTQSGNEELGMKEKNLYFLVIETPKGRLQINVGEKTHDTVKELTDVVTNIQIDTPEMKVAKAAGEALKTKGGK